MPVTPTYPGVYVEEVPSAVRTIVGVATSITAFVGSAPRGPVDEPTRVQSFAEYQRNFGGISAKHPMSYAVSHFFLNGGTDAIIVRVVVKPADDPANAAANATIELRAGTETLTLEAANPGTWGNNLRAIVDYETKDKTDTKLFNLTIQEAIQDAAGNDVVLAEEKFTNVSVDPDSPRYVAKVLKAQRAPMRIDEATVPSTQPDASGLDAEGNPIPTKSKGDGTDGGLVGDPQINADDRNEPKRGIYALEKADLFNLLCIPPFQREKDVALTTWPAALAYCKKRRAMLLVDSPSEWTTVKDAVDGANDLANQLGVTPDENAALFFPRVRMADPEKENRLEDFAPCGVLAGVFARTDAARGIWKAPAGQEATLVGVRELTYKMTDGENGRLNPLGVNCLRVFLSGIVNWGGRTLAGADRLASQWKYIPVRRVALYIEESLYRGTQWVVFEPNDEPLWAQIRLNVGSFMHDLFRQGAFQGTSPREAYFVKCDKETTTQSDIDKGIVNIDVGFAPLKPAEFVIIRISQIAGQSSS